MYIYMPFKYIYMPFKYVYICILFWSLTAVIQYYVVSLEESFFTFQNFVVQAGQEKVFLE